MEHDAILTFQAPRADSARVACHPSPTMELGYALHYLQRRVGPAAEPGDVAADHDVAWVVPLLEAHGELVRALRGFGAQHGLPELSPALLVLAARYGYDRDDAPDRFLRDLATLPTRYLADGAPPEHGDELGDEHDDDAREGAFRATIANLADERVASDLRALLARLWDAVAPAWSREGRGAVARAVAEFQASFERTLSVLEALPAHHFTRFEHLAHGIREAESRGRVVVIPLYLASTGGFNFMIDEVHYVGYGLQSETAFERTANQVASLAVRAKALGDPTRLMALALVGRFSSMRMTVGDLAQQIGVTQPTLSGHLKQLREAGLVAVERHGNKSYYTIEREGVRQLLRDLDTSLLD
ncbi:hypothetical protein BH23DEI1_BH23DEI1_18380 [soil metagenome]|nr:winged helix-turn-helix transcriptional regulator [Trueperaceae bacterium]